jgi:arginyl-tRNA synthetase
VYLELQKRLEGHLRALLAAKYDLQLETIPLEIPPELKFGELATPIAFELARKLRKAPKIIAQEIVAALTGLEGFASFEVAGAGYINARLDRTAGVRDVALQSTEIIKKLSETGVQIHSLVEHTSINPNKAAHVGHLRNAILGDTFVRLLRAAGQKVDVQNYIDNTGVQVADVVVGLLSAKAAPPTPRTRRTPSITTAGISMRRPRSGTRAARTKRMRRARSCATLPCTSWSAAATRPPR